MEEFLRFEVDHVIVQITLLLVRLASNEAFLLQIEEHAIDVFVVLVYYEILELAFAPVA